MSGDKKTLWKEGCVHAKYIYSPKQIEQIKIQGKSEATFSLIDMQEKWSETSKCRVWYHNLIGLKKLQTYVSFSHRYSLQFNV